MYVFHRGLWGNSFMVSSNSLSRILKFRKAVRILGKCEIHYLGKERITVLAIRNRYYLNGNLLFNLYKKEETWRKWKKNLLLLSKLKSSSKSPYTKTIVEKYQSVVSWKDFETFLLLSSNSTKYSYKFGSLEENSIQAPEVLSWKL